MKFKIYNLSVWNQNKEIYRYLFQEYDLEQKYFSTFDYDLIKHTNLDNFFFEIKNNYKIQYQQIKNLIKLHGDQIQQNHEDGLLSAIQNKYFHLLHSGWVSPLEFNQTTLQIQIHIKPGDLIDLKKNSGLGLYLIYQNPDSGDIMYANKTKDIFGINLPHQAWQFIEKYGWCYYGVPIGGCYLPSNVKLGSQSEFKNKVKHGFLVFMPQKFLEYPEEAQEYKINRKKYIGKIVEMSPY